MNVILKSYHLGSLLNQRRSSDESKILFHAVLDAVRSLVKCSSESVGETYEPVISPYLASSIKDFSSGAISRRAFLISESWKWVIPQSWIISHGQFNWMLRDSPVWCITTIVPGAPIVWRTAKVLMASNALPPAFRTIVASVLRQQRLIVQDIGLLLRVGSMPKTWYGFNRGSEQESTTTPAPEARIPLIISMRGGGDWYFWANRLLRASISTRGPVIFMLADGSDVGFGVVLVVVFVVELQDREDAWCDWSCCRCGGNETLKEVEGLLSIEGEAVMDLRPSILDMVMHYCWQQKPRNKCSWHEAF